MRAAVLLTLVLGAGQLDAVELLMEQAFYPVLLLILIVASLGVPIPEDIPLIVAGVLKQTHPNIASWFGILSTAMIGIMTGDLVLYLLGRRWGPDVVTHRSVRWIVTPERFERLSRRFLRHGTWFCFFGRFLMGVRAAMCLTAGATRFPYWRFFLADFCGALLSVPLFVLLGYWFAGMIPTLRAYITGAQAIITIVAVIAAGIIYVVYRRRRRARLAVKAEVGGEVPGRHAPAAHNAPAPRDAQRGAAAKPEVGPPA